MICLHWQCIGRWWWEYVLPWIGKCWGTRPLSKCFDQGSNAYYSEEWKSKKLFTKQICEILCYEKYHLVKQNWMHIGIICIPILIYCSKVSVVTELFRKDSGVLAHQRTPLFAPRSLLTAGYFWSFYSICMGRRFKLQLIGRDVLQFRSIDRQLPRQAWAIRPALRFRLHISL